jgi:hypothetical protein
MKVKSIIKLKRNYSQEREIRETVTFTAGENEVPEPDTAKEYSVNKIHKLLEYISLKVEEPNWNLDSVQVPEDVLSLTKPNHSEITENVIYAQKRKTKEDFSVKHTVQGKLKSLHKSVKIDGEIASSNSNSFSSKTNECTQIINPIPKEKGVEKTIDKLMKEKNVELRSTEITEMAEVVKVNAEKLFINQQLNQQIKIRRNQKLKK